MSRDKNKLPSTSSSADVEAFLAKVAATPVAARAAQRGRLIFAMDATASREPAWDRACHIQGQMFEQTAALGGLDIQLCHYRGFLEFEASPWVSDSSALLSHMTAVRCAGGVTQIERILDHAIVETRGRKVNALVFVGDCMEEDVDALCDKAGRLGLLAVPVFIFHEGNEPVAERVFREITRLTHGAYCRFDAGSAHQLRLLLSAVAVYAAGGRKALTALGRREGGIALQLTHQLSK